MRIYEKIRKAASPTKPESRGDTSSLLDRRLISVRLYIVSFCTVADDAKIMSSRHAKHLHVHRENLEMRRCVGRHEWAGG